MDPWEGDPWVVDPWIGIQGRDCIVVVVLNYNPVVHVNKIVKLNHGEGGSGEGRFYS